MNHGKKYFRFIIKSATIYTLIALLVLFSAHTAHAKSLRDASAGALSVDGTQLMAQGSPIRLKGVSTHGLSWYPQYVNDDMFKELHDKWGCNLVRLALYTAEYNGYCTGGASNKKALKKLIKQGVKYAKKNKLYVIIDWHILSDGNPLTHKKAAKAFFKWASKSFAGYDNVIYEICNEPNGNVTWKQIYAYAKYIIPTIRKYSDGVILVGTPNWSQDVDLITTELSDKWNNIMYTMHFYAGTHKDSYIAKLKRAQNAKIPVFISEFGICNASGNGKINKKSANKWVNELDNYNISYCIWNLSNKNESSALIKSGVTKTHGFTRKNLTASGKWFWDLLSQ